MENSLEKNIQESAKEENKESLIEKDLIAFKKLINEGYSAIGDTFKKGEYKDFGNDKLLENWSTEEIIERICYKDILELVDEICQWYHKMTGYCYIDFESCYAKKLDLRSLDICVFDLNNKTCYFRKVSGISLGRDGKFRAAHCRVDEKSNLYEELYLKKLFGCTSLCGGSRMFFIDNIFKVAVYEINKKKETEQ